jgi:hypothetical protein
MTAVAPTSFASRPIIAPSSPIAPSVDTSLSALPKPLMAGLEPHDALSLLLMSVERSSQISMGATEDKIRATRADIHEQLDKYLEQLRAALQAADDDDGGWFGNLIGSIADVVGAVVGAVADVWCDYVMLPVDVTIDLGKSIATSQSLWTALQSDLEDFGKTGEAGQAVKGCTAGVAKFAAELAAFGAKLSLALSKASVGSGDLLDSIKGDLKQLGNSFDKNILSNPDFWKVMGAVAKAAAVAGTVATGGAMGVVAVCLLAALELDKQTGFIEQAVGADAAPWLRVGLGLAAAVCGGLSGSGGSDGSDVLRAIDQVNGVAAGVRTIGLGIKSYIDDNKHADELDRQGDLMGTLNRMRQLQRLCEDLIDVLADKSKDHSTQQGQASTLYQTQGATELATLMRA